MKPQQKLVLIQECCEYEDKYKPIIKENSSL